MHPFSILTLGIFVAGYITARRDLVTRLYELAIFAWDHGVVVRVHFQLFYLSRDFRTGSANQLRLYRPEPQRDFSSSPFSFSSSSFQSTTLRKRSLVRYAKSSFIWSAPSRTEANSLLLLNSTLDLSTSVSPLGSNYAVEARSSL